MSIKICYENIVYVIFLLGGLNKNNFVEKTSSSPSKEPKRVTLLILYCTLLGSISYSILSLLCKDIFVRLDIE